MGGCATFCTGLVCLIVGSGITGVSLYFTRDQWYHFVFEPQEARCDLLNNVGTVGAGVVGTLVLFEKDNDLHIAGNITGLSPGLHGFHVHKLGVPVLSSGFADCAAATGHYNPDGYNHAAPSDDERHIGDLGNIEADADGFALVDITDPVATLYGDRSIIGRSLVVHAGQDDLGTGGDEGSLATGNAGGRLACCNIYIAP